MSKSNKKKMEQLRKRQLKARKKMEKIALITITIAILVVVGIHYGASAINVSHTVTKSTKKALSYFNVSLINGGTVSTKSLEGQPLVVWLMTTWCSSCAETSELLVSQYYNTFRSDGIRLLQIENYNDLNQQGQSLPAFVSQYGGSNEPGWYIGTAPQWVTQQYNPAGVLDIYYLVNSQGYIVGSGQGLGSNLNTVIATLG
jgi:hypothetical protein